MAKKAITPDLTLFEKLGARSRAFPMVITELVDNSLDSWILLPENKKKNKKLKIEITASEAKNAWFVIKDNAGGMTEDQLIESMTVAKSQKTGDSRFIGTFGLGLKSAAMYIGGVFHIYSLSWKNPKVVNYVEFDKQKFVKGDKWELDFKSMSVDAAAKLGITFRDGHGTIIQIKNDRYRHANKPGIIRRLRRTFAPRLMKNPRLKTKFPEYNEDLSLFFNDEPITAAGTFYEYWNNSVKDVETRYNALLADAKKSKGKPDFHAKMDALKKTDYIKSITPENEKEKNEPAVIPTKIKWITDIPGVTLIPEASISDPKKEKSPKKVWGRIGILDRGMAHSNEYGFDLIKNGRVIEEFVLDKNISNRDIGLVASNHNARIVGQLFLDDWDTDHQKLSFLKDSDQWQNLTEYVAKQVKPFLSVSSDMQHPAEPIRDLFKLGRDENSPEAIAEKKFSDNIPNMKKGLQKAIRSDNVKDTLNKLENDRKKELEKPKKVVPTKAASTSKLLFTKPEIEFLRKGEQGPLVVTKVKHEQSGDILEIGLNRDHPFLKMRESAELNAIGEFLAIDYYASYVLSNKESLTHEDFIKLRDTLLKELNLRK